jgi:RNA polymerase sigma-70 factor (ECF subfamily)
MGSADRRDDAQLWLDGRTDPASFGELYERHSRAVFAFCARRSGDLVLAEDLTSVVFLEAWRKRGAVTLSSSSALPWLLGTANNVSRNSHRALRRYRGALQRLPRDAPTASAEDDVIARLDAQRALAEALRAIESLSQAEQEVVNLVLWSELSYEDAASALGVPVGTVRSRLARARTKLAGGLTDADTSEPVAPDDREKAESP